ncbi:MAG: MFS transporter [Chloroflexi bacterium]|nr:MFS transporter [Chloroflexota bacterium]
MSYGERAVASLSSAKLWLGLERKWWVLLAIGLGNFMTTINSGVVNTSLPLILKSFGGTFSSIEWVVLAYLLTLASLLLTFGRVGDIVGHKPVYVGGFAVFILGAVLCGLAPSEWWLVAFRAFQGLGAAMLAANSPAILTNVFPPSQRGQALGLQGTITYLGLMVGPSLGGYIADSFGWQWIFYINVPVGVVATLLAVAVVPIVESTKKREGFDPFGAATVTVGLALLLLALSHGQEWGWTSPTTFATLFVSIALLVSFVRIERLVQFPMVDLTLFGNRLFSAGTTAALVNYMCTYAVTFLMPFYMLQGRGYSATTAGLLLTGMSLTMAVVAPLSGALSDRIGSRLPSSLGMAITAISLVDLAFLGPDSTYEAIVLGLVLVGLGVGLFVPPNSSALLGAAPPQRRGVASGIVAMARNSGMVMGVAVAGAVFSAGIARWTPLTPELALFNATREAFLALAGIAAVGTAVSLLRGPQLANDEPPKDRA